MQKISITRTITIPDQLRLERYRKSPELGPKILFFSGGTALNPLSRELTDYTHNSIHLVTPFDSGGSSAIIRDAFQMLSVGDLRSRLMALADRTITGHPEIYRLFAYRLPKDQSQTALKARLHQMVEGDNKLVAEIPDPMRKIIRSHLRFFYDSMPEDFDLKGASIGNLILVGGFLNNNRHMDPVLFMFSKLVNVRGTVRTIVSSSLHLIAKLENGQIIRGQRNLTGKETAPIKSPVADFYITNNLESADRFEIGIREKTRRMIAEAEIICYPVGSFYSSIIANLLPNGVAQAISENLCPKVYIPNTGIDPEQYGITLNECVARLIHYLQNDSDHERPVEQLLNFIIVDKKNGDYPGPVDWDAIRAMGVEIIDAELVNPEHGPYLDEPKLIEILLSLV